MANALLDLYYQGLVPQPVSMPASDDPKTLAELGIRGFGPVTQASRAGRMAQPQGEMRAAPMEAFWPAPAQIAAEVAKAPYYAGEAIGEAALDPTLANVTDAGARTAMLVPTLRGARAAAGVLAGGYGVAAARDIGIDPIGGAEANEPDPLDPGQRARLNALQAKQAKGRSLSKAERLEQESYNGVLAAASSRAAELRAEAKAAEDASAQAEYDRSVGNAELARDKELADNQRFSDSEVGKVYAKTGIITPFLAAAGVGAVSRLSSGGGNAIKNYAVPAAEGGAAGIVTANYPLMHDSYFTRPDNPERRAYEAYARELPPGHPRKQEWQDYARELPQENPVRAVASAELYDPVKLAERSGLGVVEGVLGGVTGSQLAKLPGRAIEGAAAIPGRVRAAYAQSNARADAIKSADRAPLAGESAIPTRTEATVPPQTAQGSTPTQLSDLGFQSPQPAQAIPASTPSPRRQTRAQTPQSPISGQSAPSAPSSKSPRPSSLSESDAAKIRSAVYAKMQRDGSLEGLTARDLGVDLSGKGATPENIRAYIAKLASMSDDLSAAGVPVGQRQADLMAKLRSDGVKFAVPGTAIGAASMSAGQDDFDAALNEARQILIDIDGDGIPDIAVPR